MIRIFFLLGPVLCWSPLIVAQIDIQKVQQSKEEYEYEDISVFGWVFHNIGSTMDSIEISTIADLAEVESGQPINMNGTDYRESYIIKTIPPGEKYFYLQDFRELKSALNLKPNIKYSYNMRARYRGNPVSIAPAIVMVKDEISPEIQTFKGLIRSTLSSAQNKNEALYHLYQKTLPLASEKLKAYMARRILYYFGESTYDISHMLDFGWTLLQYTIDRQYAAFLFAVYYKSTNIDDRLKMLSLLRQDQNAYSVFKSNMLRWYPEIIIE